MITSVGENVVLWVSKGDVGKYVSSDIPAANIHYYTQGNASGTAGKSDIFVLHEGSTYTQGDNTQHAMNAVNGNRESTTSSAHDYIFVAGASAWSSSAGSANINNSINYYESVNVTIGNKTYGGNNRVSDVISGKGEEGLNQGDHDVKTSWHYDLNIDANLEGGADGDHITSISLGGLPVGSNLSYQGVNYTVDAHGNVVIDVQDSADLNAHLTLTSPTEVTNPGSITVDISTEVGGSQHTSGDIDANSGEHSIAVSESAHTYSAETLDEEHHDAVAHTDTTEHADMTTSAENHSDSELTDNSASEHTDNTDSAAQTENTATSDLAENASATDHGSDNLTNDDPSTSQDNASLLIDHEDLDLSTVDSDTSAVQSTNENPETSLNLLLGDIDTQLNDTDAAQSEASVAEKSAPAESAEMNTENVINLSDIIHDDGAKDLSSLIQVADATDNTQAVGHVQDVPAESAGSDSAEVWDAHGAAELDHLIAQPDSEV
ncbi:hypothetical protein [Kluyvera intermedia]|uniref:hypothetical protein n=1 Tax=Kluyvera intermedia TaxID=61648 RepID=UPI00372D1E2A